MCRWMACCVVSREIYASRATWDKSPIFSLLVNAARGKPPIWRCSTNASGRISIRHIARFFCVKNIPASTDFGASMNGFWNSLPKITASLQHPAPCMRYAAKRKRSWPWQWPKVRCANFGATPASAFCCSSIILTSLWKANCYPIPETGGCALYCNSIPPWCWLQPLPSPCMR